MFSIRYPTGTVPPLAHEFDNRNVDIVKLDDYQEPYQALKYAPYYSYSTIIMEMKDMMLNNMASNAVNYTAGKIYYAIIPQSLL